LNVSLCFADFVTIQEDTSSSKDNSAVGLEVNLLTFCHNFSINVDIFHGFVTFRDKESLVSTSFKRAVFGLNTNTSKFHEHAFTTSSGFGVFAQIEEDFSIKHSIFVQVHDLGSS
jgi:hypothetical protein